jgi:serine/threonine-protein kinase RsbW
MYETGGNPGFNDRASLRQLARPDALPVVRGMVARFVARLDFPATRSGDVQLAVTEACANVVRHAYPDGEGDVLCECEATADEIVVRVCDWGVGSDQPSAKPGLGLGIQLIERLSDHASHRHSAGMTLVEMRFARQPDPITG